MEDDEVATTSKNNGKPGKTGSDNDHDMSGTVDHEGHKILEEQLPESILKDPFRLKPLKVQAEAIRAQQQMLVEATAKYTEDRSTAITIWKIVQMATDSYLLEQGKKELNFTEESEAFLKHVESKLGVKVYKFKCFHIIGL